MLNIFFKYSPNIVGRPKTKKFKCDLTHVDKKCSEYCLTKHVVRRVNNVLIY